MSDSTAPGTTGDEPLRPLVTDCDGRCPECGWHVPTQGHHGRCSGPEPCKSPPTPPAPPGIHYLTWWLYSSGFLEKAHREGLIADDSYRRTRDKVEHALNPPQPRAALPASEVGAGRRRSYCLHGLSRELRRLAGTPEGGRNDQLNTSAFKCARFVRDGVLSRDEVVGPLRETAIGTGLPASEVDSTIRSAFGGADAKGLTTEIPDRDGVGDAYQIGGAP